MSGIESIASRSIENPETIFNSLDAMILLTEPETGVVVYANNKMKENYGVTIDPVGKRCYEIFQKNKRQRCDFLPRSEVDGTPGYPGRMGNVQ